MNDAKNWGNLSIGLSSANSESKGPEALEILHEFKELEIPKEYDSRLAEIWIGAKAVSIDLLRSAGQPDQ